MWMHVCLWACVIDSLMLYNERAAIELLNEKKWIHLQIHNAYTYET